MRVVWPVVRERIGGGRLLTVEGHADDLMRKHLDTLAGIDGWQVMNDHGMRGLASRIQYLSPNDTVWESHTVRSKRDSGAKTELEKRMEAIQHPENGLLYPHLTIQAYLEKPRREGGLICLGIIRTTDLFDYLSKHQHVIQPRRTTNAEFYPVFWDKLRKAGYRIAIWRKQV